MINKYKWEKKGFIYKPTSEAPLWHSHAMAPTAFVFNKKVIRVFVGGWTKEKISRIWYIDLDINNPSNVLQISKKYVVDIGKDGCFDDNGVFPAHVYKHPDGRVFLYYTGFQKLDKIAFSNFSGLAISCDGGDTFKKVSQAPIMDRADEGLYTRAGTSVIFKDNNFKACYSVGSSWYNIAGKDRPVYDVNYIESKNGIDFGTVGKKIVEVDLSKEHGLGRPQIVELKGQEFVFYTRRTIDFKYYIGCARKINDEWQRCDDWLSTIKHGNENDFDNEMVYFPCVVETPKKTFLFYVGNGYGKDGFGYAELVEK